MKIYWWRLRRYAYSFRMSVWLWIRDGKWRWGCTPWGEYRDRKARRAEEKTWTP